MVRKTRSATKSRKVRKARRKASRRQGGRWGPKSTKVVHEAYARGIVETDPYATPRLRADTLQDYMYQPNLIFEDIRIFRTTNPTRAQQIDNYAIQFLADHFDTTKNVVQEQILPMWARAPIA